MTSIVHRMGELAALVETDDPAGYAAAVAHAVESGALHDVIDIVPAAATVLVRFPDSTGVDLDVLSALEPRHRDLDDPHLTLDVPVQYDGGDLDSLLAETRLTRDEVVDIHSGAVYRVDFCGFAPGFGYLSGVDSRLHVPRLPSPRPRVPRGSVALAAGYTAVYPGSSPGGWRLIGRTNLALFDPHRDPAALLRPGMSVRFHPVDRLPEETRNSPPASAIGTPAWEVLDPGPLTLIQDLGRPGHGAIAVGGSGAFDREAHRLANRLVGNAEGSAALEVIGGGLAMRALRTATVAVLGAGAHALVDSLPISANAPVTVRAGQTLHLLPPLSGLRSIIALRGGVVAQEALGSASYDTLAGLGPAALAAGHILSVGVEADALAVDHVPVEAAADVITLSVAPGPRANWFTTASWEVLLSSTFIVSPRSDRIGVRLEGPAIRRTDAAEGRELPPEGMVRGAIQVPPGGEPVILGPDHPVTGGYPVIAVVADAAVDRLAQATPGTKVRFVAPR